MSWNYRIVKETYEDGGELYNIREVYYDDSGNVNGWTADACWPSGADYDEFIADMERYLTALQKPIVDVVVS